jgi:hypothetical protein
VDTTGRRRAGRLPLGGPPRVIYLIGRRLRQEARITAFGEIRPYRGKVLRAMPLLQVV